MAHRLILSPQAEHDLLALSPTIRQHLIGDLRRLAETPTALSRPSHFPYQPDCQLFRPEPLVTEDGRHEFMVLFRYGQDEDSLQIIGIGHYVLG